MMQRFVGKLWHGCTAVVRQLHYTILAIVAPPLCARCRASLSEETVFCVPCSARVHKVATHALVITKRYSVVVFAASAYQESVQELIIAKKHRKRYAARLLGVLIWEHTDLCNQTFDYIVPVPLHWRRYAERGYNQAHEIARELSTKSGKPVLNCLQRLRATKIQAGLSATERVENVDDAFIVDERYGEKVRGARILLVDDVMTTGSTVRECVRALRMKRPLVIITAVAARVV